MPRAYEIPTSRTFTDGKYELTFGVEGTTDDAEAEGLAVAEAPLFHRGLPRSPLPIYREEARGIYQFTWTYELGNSTEQNENEPQGDLPTIGRLNIKPSGGTQHITQCLFQIGYHNLGAGATENIEIARVIGLHKDGVHGCDVRKPGSIITLEKMFLPQAITGDYIAALQRLDGKQNFNAYTMQWARAGTLYQMTFETGELQFAGADLSISLTPKGFSAWTIGYTFLFSPNRYDVAFGGESQDINVPVIGGHSYVWAYYEKKEITGVISATIEVPKAVFVSHVCEQADFATVLGF